MEATRILAEELLATREHVAASQQARDAVLATLEGSMGDRHDYLLSLLEAKEDDIARAHDAQTAIYSALSVTPQITIVTSGEDIETDDEPDTDPANTAGAVDGVLVHDNPAPTHHPIPFVNGIESFTRDPHPSHPMQPIVMVDGVAHFKSNAIISRLFRSGCVDWNRIARMSDIPKGDRMQIAQLLGCSVCHFGNLADADPDVVTEAYRQVEELLTRDKKALDHYSEGNLPSAD